MSEMISIVYPDKETALAARSKVLQMNAEFLVEVADAVVVTKDKDGKVDLHQQVNLTQKGAIGGGMWGGLIGLLFLNPLLGLAVGAAAGALSGRFTDYGIPDDQMRQIAKSFQPGTAALFVLLRKVTPDKFTAEMSKLGGTILRTSLSNEEERKLREALSSHVASLSPPSAAAPATP
jgi:uncharacterized membrane protein